MERLDHRKLLKHLYSAPRRTPVLVDVPPMNYLVIDGSGKPDGEMFQQAASALYPLAYTLKHMLRAGHDLDIHVMPMEVLWRVNRPEKKFDWTMMLMQPEPIDNTLVEEARAKAGQKSSPALLEQVRFEKIHEKSCVQQLHCGPYPEMEITMEHMMRFAKESGCEVPSRSTHDIYLNDSRKTRPENLKTIMRLAVNCPGC